MSAYAIERAAQGGRLTVDMVRRTTPALDPTNYEPGTYNQVLDDRRRDLYNKMYDAGFSNKNVKDLVKSKEQYESYPTFDEGSKENKAPQGKGTKEDPIKLD